MSVTRLARELGSLRRDAPVVGAPFLLTVRDEAARWLPRARVPACRSESNPRRSTQVDAGLAGTEGYVAFATGFCPWWRSQVKASSKSPNISTVTPFLA